MPILQPQERCAAICTIIKQALADLTPTNQTPRRFLSGQSHYRYEGEWVEEKVTEAIVTDTHIAVDIDSQGHGGTGYYKSHICGQRTKLLKCLQAIRNTYPPGNVDLKRYEASR